METYNYYLTSGILDGTIKTKYVDGVTCYVVRKPKESEPVMGYTNFSSMVVHKTETEIAAQEN